MRNFFRKFHFQKSQTVEIVFIFSIVILAAFLRLYHIEDYMTFLGDEGRDVLVVKRIIVDHKFTLLGPTASVGGFFLGPIYYYFMVPFLWLARLDPVGPAVMVALFGTATVFLIYQVGKSFFGKTAGIISATLYAISPLIIAYSRSSWNPNLMPFFSLFIIFLCWKIVVDNRWSLMFVMGLLFGILFQLHYLATFLLVIVAVYILNSGRFTKIKAYIKWAIGFFVGLSPFILFEIRHDFPNLRMLIKFIFTSEDTGFTLGKFVPIVTDVFIRLFSRLLANNNINLAVIAMGVSLIAVFLMFKQSRGKRSQQKATFQIIVFWLVIGVLLFGFYRKGIYDYYFGFMFPLPFLLVGVGLAKIFHSNIFGRFIAVVILAALVSVNLKGIPFQHQPNRQLAQTKAVARSIFEKANQKPLNLALITGGNSDHAYRYFLEVWKNPPVTIENTEKDPQRKTVTDQLFVICEKDECKPLGDSLWEIAGFGRAEISDSWKVSVIKVFRLIHYQESK